MPRWKNNRRGATVLEMSLILFTFLVLTMGALDLGVGVFRYHILANAARQGARQAIVHGDQASVLGAWGPGAIDAAGTESGVPIVAQLQPLLIGCDLANTRIQVEWLGASNAFEKPVRVTVRSPYRHVLLFIFPGTEVTLTASSTMQIAH